MTSKIIQQGAEAIISLNKDIITKNRIPKSYRLPLLDEKIRKQRTKREATILTKLQSIIPVPKLISVKDNKLELEYIKGKKLSESLDNLKDAVEVCKQIGINLSKIHDNNIMHGDLTTSNMILSEKDNKLYFIDFGLSFTSAKPEDKAVDLHLIKEALEAKHFTHHKEFFEAIINGYKVSKNAQIAIERLKKVESRGRYRQQY